MFRVLPGCDGLYIGDRYRGASKLDSVSLEPRWLFAGEDLSPVAVKNDVVLIAGNEGLCAVDERSGGKLWGPRPVGPCIEWSQRLLTLRPLGFLDVKQGSVYHELKVSEEFLGDPFVAGDVLVGTNLRGDPISAYHLVEQRLVWKRRILAELDARAGRSEPARIVSAGGETFVIGRTDMLAGCSLTDGSILWDLPLGVPYYLPNVHGGRIYVLLAGNTLPARFICIEAQGGQKLYDVQHPFMQLGNKPFHGTLAGKEIVFCTSRDLVVAFRLEDGSVSWSHQSREGVGRAISIDERVLVPTPGGNFLVFEPNAS